MKLKHSLAAIALLLGLLAVTTQAQNLGVTPGSDTTQDCMTRECLIKLADDYFAALVAHNPATLPFAANAKFVENAYRKPVGEGLWRSASAVPSSFKIYVPDPVSEQVGFLGMMEEDGKPLMIGLRIQLMKGKITEVEHVLARNLRDTMLDNLKAPRPGINTEIPLAQRLPRWQLIGLGYSYYDALELDNGNLSPMAADCERHENGMITVKPIPETQPEGPPNFTLMGCQGQLNTGVMSYIDALDNRRVELADPVTGLVMGFSHFRHAMEKKTISIVGVPGVEEREMPFNAFDLPAAHIFKVGADGWIHEIEAMGFATPYMAKTGWE